MNDMIAVAERIANDNKLPGRIVDWACDMFDRLNSPSESITIKDLRSLQNIVYDYDYGLTLIDRRLASE